MIEQVTNVFYRALCLLLLFINGIMVQKYKKTTRATLYRPKTHSEYTFNRFMKQFADPYTFGIDNKEHYHTKKYINDIITTNLKWFKNRGETQILTDEESFCPTKLYLLYQPPG